MTSETAEHTIDPSVLTSREAPFYEPGDQEKIFRGRLLIAGLGGGSRTAELAARMGVGSMDPGMITLADPDTVDSTNLNRQAFTTSHVGQNKAEAAAHFIDGINPYIRTEVVPEGMTLENTEEMVSTSDVVVEMVDIAAPAVTAHIHDVAQRYRKPIVTGMDIGDSVIVYVFDYRNSDQMSYRRFLGLPQDTTLEQFNELSRLGLAAQHLLGNAPEFASFEEAKEYYDGIFETRGVEILESMPEEMRRVMPGILSGEFDFIPQSGEAAAELGNVQNAILKKILLGKSVKAAPDAIVLNIAELIGVK